MTADDLMRLVTRWRFPTTQDDEGALHAQIQAEVTRLHAEAAKSERRAIEFGDLMTKHILVMRAAVVDAAINGPAAGMAWIQNTLDGPDQLPDIYEARALGGAQALFDKEMAEHEKFRAEHPAP